MAKTLIKTEKTLEDLGFTWEDAPALATRGIGASGVSPELKRIRNLPEPANGKFARLFFPVGAAPETITDPVEISKWTNGELRKTVNRFNGMTRRVRIDKKDTSRSNATYAVRIVEHMGVAGVGVSRLANTTPWGTVSEPVVVAA